MKNNQTYSIFINSGCLSREAMQSFAEGRLTIEETVPVQAHLKHCPLCADALEGFMLYNDPDQFKQTVQMLNLRIQTELVGKIDNTRKFIYLRRNKPTLFVISVAASVTIILGIWSIVNNSRMVPYNKPIAQNFESVTGPAADTLLPPPQDEPVTLIQKTQTKQPPSPAENKKTVFARDIKPQTKPVEETAADSKGEWKEIIKTDKLADETGISPGESAVIEIVMPEPERKETLKEEKYFAAGYSARSASINGRNLASKTGLKNEATETIFAVVDEMPRFKNKGVEEFQKYIREHIQYPDKAVENNIEGTVVVGFVVDPTGQVTKVKLINMVDSLLDAEALRVVSSSPLWKPGKQSGKPVSVSVTIPVGFRLQPD
jgi:TonB family protein